MNSKTYQQALEKHIWPNLAFLSEENLKFRQDNALVHGSNSIKHWILINNVEILKWPAKSPDLNSLKSHGGT